MRGLVMDRPAVDAIAVDEIAETTLSAVLSVSLLPFFCLLTGSSSLRRKTIGCLHDKCSMESHPNNLTCVIAVPSSSALPQSIPDRDTDFCI